MHPNGPSVLAETGESLSAHLTANPELLGEPVSTRFNSQLPFLFKVLRCFISSPIYVCSLFKPQGLKRVVANPGRICIIFPDRKLFY